MPASTTIRWALMPLERGLSRNAATWAASSVCDRLLARDDLLGVEIRIDVAGDARRGRGLQQPRGDGVEPHPGEPAERLGQEGQASESRAALIGAM